MTVVTAALQYDTMHLVCTERIMYLKYNLLKMMYAQEMMFFVLRQVFSKLLRISERQYCVLRPN